MNDQKFESLFPKTSRNSRNRISVRHERGISKGVAQHIRIFITDKEADSMTFKGLIEAAKQRSGFADANRPVPTKGYDTYFFADSLLEPQFTAATYDDSRLRAEAGEAYEAILEFRKNAQFTQDSK